MHPYTEILGAPGDGLGGVPWGRDIPDLTSPLPVGVQNIGLQLEGKETQYPMVGGAVCVHLGANTGWYPRSTVTLLVTLCLRDHNTDSQINTTMAG